MNEILLNALIARIRAGQMIIEQAPVPYKEELQTILEQEESEE